MAWREETQHIASVIETAIVPQMVINRTSVVIPYAYL